MKTIHIAAAASLFAVALLPATAFAYGGKSHGQVVTTTTTTTTHYSQSMHPRQAALQHAQGRGKGQHKSKHQAQYQHRHQYRYHQPQPTQIIYVPARVEPSLQIRIGYRIDL
jgi:hypothetical protein